MVKTKEFLVKNKEILVPTITLFLICLVITAALGVTNYFTSGRIAALEKKAQVEAMNLLLPADAYAPIEDGISYCAVKESETIGYIFITVEKGYGGEIKVMTAVGIDGAVNAVTVLSAGDETPGLGQNVTKKAFLDRYIGHFKGIEVVKNNADSSLNQIDAVTGATISSRATTKAVNKALEMYENIVNTASKEVA